MSPGRASLPSILLLWLTVSLSGQPAIGTWSDAIRPLVEERTLAEDCVALLKKYGGESQIDRGRIAYVRAKADSDGVIAGLLISLSTGASPPDWRTLQDRLEHSNSGLRDFCQSVSDLVPIPRPGEKDLVANIAKAIIEPLLKMVSAGVSAIYNDHQNSSAIIKKSIQTALEAARWPEFAKVERAK